MADAKKVASLLGDDKEEKEKKAKKGKKIKIVGITQVKMIDFKNILVTAAAAIACFQAITTIGPASLAFGGPVALAVTAGLSVFEMWSSKQIRKKGQVFAAKHSIKKCETAAQANLRAKNTDDAIIMGQIVLYLVSMLKYIPTGPFIVPAVIFGATGIAAKLSQRLSREKIEYKDCEKGKER